VAVFLQHGRAVVSGLPALVISLADLSQLDRAFDFAVVLFDDGLLGHAPAAGREPNQTVAGRWRKPWAGGGSAWTQY